MKKSYLFLSGLLLVGLASCDTGSSSLSSSSSSSGNVSTSSSSSSSSTSSSVLRTSLLKDALKKDYSNMTVLMQSKLYDSSFDITYEDETAEYYYNGYTIISYYSNDEIQYSFYHEYENKSYLWFNKESNNDASKAGWLNKGWRDADLSLGRTYFDFNDVLENLNPDDVAYINGKYFVNDKETCNEMAFSFLGELNAQSLNVNYIEFEIDKDGYLSRIFASENPDDDEANCLDFRMFNINATTFMDDILPVAPNSNNVIEYWQYKGWNGPWVDKFVDSISIATTGNIKTEEGFDAVLEMDEVLNLSSTFLPNDYNVEPDLEWHYTNPGVVTAESGTKQFTGKVTGIDGGETEVYATYERNGETITSNKLKIKVIGTPEQNKEDAIYDFTLIHVDEEGKVTADNKVKTNTKPFTITTTNPSNGKVDIRDGKNSSEKVFKEGEKVVLLMNAGTSVSYGMDSFIMFDFGDEQQVSSISLYYAMFYNSGMNGLPFMNKLAIETSNDGENWETLDILQEVKVNVNDRHKKLLEKEFAPASKVRIAAHCSMIGKELNLGLTDIAFMANEQCNNYLEPTEKVNVESVELSSTSTEVYVGSTLEFFGRVYPSNASKPQLTYYSTNEEVATIENGVLTGLSAGQTEVYAIADGVSSEHITITVKDLPQLDEKLVGSFKGEVNTDVLTLSFENKSLTAIYKNKTYNLEYNDYIDDSSVSGKYNVFADENGNYLNVRYSSYESKVIFNGKLGNDTLNSDLVKYVPATSMTLSTTKTELVYGIDTTFVVKANFNPSSATGYGVKELTWASTNPNVVMVNDTSADSNLVTIVGTGSATIMAVSKDGLSAVLNVVVREKRLVQTITLTETETTIEQGFEYQVEAEVNAEADVKDLTYTSSDPKIATVSKSGKVTAVKVGTATITVAAADGSGVSTTLAVNVIPSTSAVDAYFIGEWSAETASGSIINLSVTNDGKAIMTCDDLGFSKEFLVTESNDEQYTFTADDGTTLILTEGASYMFATYNGEELFMALYGKFDGVTFSK